jgi:hypothetical protein
MARARFPDSRGAAHAFACFTYDMEETTVYATGQDTDDEEQVVLNTASAVTPLRADLYA